MIVAPWSQAPVLEGFVASLEFLPPELLLEICTCDKDGNQWPGVGEKLQKCKT